jgi:hypothetical protein
VTDPGGAYVVRVEGWLVPREEGGRLRPIGPGFRPLCTPFESVNPLVGSCEVLEGTIEPGAAGRIRLAFAEPVASVAREAFPMGAGIMLREGLVVVAWGRVIAVPG